MDRHRHLFAFDTAYRLFGCHFDRRAYEKVSLLPISARTSLLYSVCWKKRFATPKKLALNFLSIGNDEVVVTTVEPEDAKAGQDKARFLSNPMVISPKNRKRSVYVVRIEDLGAALMSLQRNNIRLEHVSITRISRDRRT